MAQVGFHRPEDDNNLSVPVAQPPNTSEHLCTLTCTSYSITLFCFHTFKLNSPE